MSQALESFDLRSAGSAQIDGVNTEQYELVGPGFADITASMGLSDPGATLTDTSAYLFASPDGKPVELTLTFKTSSPDGTIHASDYSFAFGPSPTPVSIDAPADPWIRKADGHGYRMWYPESWTENLVGEDAGGFTEDFIGPDGKVRVFCSPKANLKLNKWAADGRAFYGRRFGKPDGIRRADGRRIAGPLDALGPGVGRRHARVHRQPRPGQGTGRLRHPVVPRPRADRPAGRRVHECVGLVRAGLTTAPRSHSMTSATTSGPSGSFIVSWRRPG